MGKSDNQKNGQAVPELSLDDQIEALRAKGIQVVGAGNRGPSIKSRMIDLMTGAKGASKKEFYDEIGIDHKTTIDLWIYKIKSIDHKILKSNDRFYYRSLDQIKKGGEIS